MRQRSGLALLALAVLGLSSATLLFAQDELRLPSRFEENRFFIAPVTVSDDTLLFYTDTGGGLFIYEDVVERLDLPVDTMKTGDNAVRVAHLPEFRPDAAIPPPGGPFGGRLPVLAVDERRAVAASWSGMLGQDWFANRVWVFDYPRRELQLREPDALLEAESTHTVDLGFKSDSTGKRSAHFPRIQAVIEGDSLDLLFDTGAMVILTPSARETLGGGAEVRGASFIVQQVFDRWRTRHPEWRLIEDADQSVPGSAMIEVPEILVAGHTVGPVWFTVRPNENFHDFMSQWMDRRVDGALGGSALHFFRITVDYPAAKAHFNFPERPPADSPGTW